MYKEERAIITKFAGDRALTEGVQDIIENHKVDLQNIIYRGLPYPKHLLKVGNVIEEWYSSSHWSLKSEVALKFCTNQINEEYSEMLQKEYSMSERALFAKVVMILDTPKNVFELYKYIDNKLAEEKEITIVGYDFKIDDIMLLEKENIYIIYVSQIER